MKLTAEQTEDLPFPVGCPVWYGFPEGKEGGGAPQLLKEGVVDSVSFDVISKDMVYVVTYDDGKGTKVVDTIPEKNLAYAANCPVTISSHGKESAEGTILLCEPSNEEPRQLLYTAMVPTEGCRARYESGIERGRLKFRRVGKLEVVTQREQPAAKAPADSSLVGDEVVPSSITCDSVAKSSHSKQGSSKRGASGDSSQASNTAKKARVDASSALSDTKPDAKQHDPMMKIIVPRWLQQDSRTQQRLFHHLIGNTRQNIGGVGQIGMETNCRIYVRFNAKRAVDPMVIEIDPISKSKSIALAHVIHKIADLFLGFHDVEQDGARGRLVHEIAVQCRGPHRPNKSSSRAIKAKNPFNDRFEWMAVVELPYEVYKDRREYHGSYLQDRRFLDEIATVDTRKGSSVIVCGDEFGLSTRFCNPYALVTAGYWQGADKATRMVKDEIRRHMDKCVCRYMGY